MQLEVVRGGKSSTVDIELPDGDLSAQEWRRVEEVLGAEAVEKIMDTGKVPRTPGLLLAFIYARLLHTAFSDLTFDEIDFDYSQLLEAATDEQEKQWVEEGNVIPMETADQATG